MHRHNRKYGHSEILAEYCGEDASQPIMGEVQHSLFLSTHHFKSNGEIGPPRAFGAMGAPLLSWNLLLPVRNQIAIGDPLLYSSLADTSSDRSSDGEDTSVPIVMPKLNEELSEELRLKDYLRLVDIAKDVSTAKRVLLSVHPRDLALVHKLNRTRHDIEVYRPLGSAGAAIDSGSTSHWERLNTKRLIVSDYFGAHVFRANAYFGAKIYVDPARALHRAIHPELRPLLLEFLELHSGDKRREDISREILGAEFKKQPEELAEILYRPELLEPTRRIWIASYKYARRARVTLRRFEPKLTRGLSQVKRKRTVMSLNKQFPPFDRNGLETYG